MSGRLSTSCGHCYGRSAYLSRGGHDPACPRAQKIPVTATRPPEIEIETEATP